MSGGWSPVASVTEAMKSICFEVQPAIEEILKNTFSIYKPLTFRSKDVGGKRYLVKVDVGEDCVHASISQNAVGKMTVNDAEYRKLSDPLVPF